MEVGGELLVSQQQYFVIDYSALTYAKNQKGLKDIIAFKAL